MKNLWRELVINTKEMGLRRTIEMTLGRLEDYTCDLWYGTETMRLVVRDDLGAEGENRLRTGGYQASTTGHFRRLMKRLDLPADSVFVDFGSGKGKVLMLASRYGFRKVVGVEFSPKLCEVARRNAAKYERRVRGTAQIEVYEGDAAEYVIEDDENVFFFFRPFDVQVMSRVLGNILTSLGKRPRKIWLINHDHLGHLPSIYRDMLEGQDSVFARSTQYVSSGFESIVYVNSR